MARACVGHLLLVEPDHQLVVDIEAARVQVRRPHIDDVIGDDELGVEDLRLVFVNLHPGLEETAIETLPGQLRDQHVGLARQDQLHRAAAPRDAREVPPDAPRRQEIGDHDLHVGCARQIAAQSPLDRAAPASRTAEQELLVRGQHHLPGRGFPQADEALVLKISAREHLLEGGRQLRRQRPAHLQPQIAPAARHPVAVVLGRNVEPADERDPLVAYQQLAMVANSQPVQGERIELPDLAPRRAQRLPERGRQPDRAQGVHQHPHARAPLPGADQRLTKSFPQESAA